MRPGAAKPYRGKGRSRRRLAPYVALEAGGVAVELGPVKRTGATGPIESLCIRDTDGNLVEISTY